MCRKSSLRLILVLLVLSASQLCWGRAAVNDFGDKGQWGGSSAAGAPAHCIAGHRVGQIVLGVNANGTFGTGFAVTGTQDCFTGQGVRSCEYPKGSNVEYLYAGAFWIGAVVGRDTLVSVGADGWNFMREFNPDEAPFGEMKFRSIIDPSKPEFEGAISEEDYISTYSDTYTEGIGVDIVSQRPHTPLHVEITEASYAWSYSYAEDIILFDYKIRNIGDRKLQNVYMGIYVDADVCYDCNATNGYADDICGFVHTSPGFCETCEYENEVNIAWIADNEGDYNAAVRAPDVTATRIVRTPAENLDVSFNWWISNGAPQLDFGPREQSEKGLWAEEFRDFGGFLGTPEGDANKYYIMRNREFDYDQAYTASILPTDTLWIDPGADAARFATGYDTRYLLSFGPFDISPGDVLPISFAYLAGENFHQVPGNIANLPNNPNQFYKNLNFDSLGVNSRWASWIYDNPGLDTDSDGYRGEIFVCNSDSVLVDSAIIPNTDPVEWEYFFDYTAADTCYITGDGVADFKGAAPPPAPKVWIEPSDGSFKVRFNGLRSETTKDAFLNAIDFEGYRVYIARDERAASFTTIASYDIEDFNRFVWNDRRPGGAGYQLLDEPFTRQELQCLYGVDCDSSDFNPLDYTPNSPLRLACCADSQFYFEAQDYNVSELGVTTSIRKPAKYAGQTFPSTLVPEDADPDELTDDGYFKYFEYEIIIEDLLPTVPYWVNVSAFDFGSPSSGLGSLETAPSQGPVVAYPLASEQQVAQKGLKAYVYPNPYRGDGGYRASSFENPPNEHFSVERQRRIHFANLPAKCTIRIFSLDGDLVREIEHNIPTSDPTASHETWDLITRNTQSAVSGLYYWTIEEEDGTIQMGKLVIIM